MPLKTSITGIRGVFGDGLTPDLLVGYSKAFGAWLQERSDGRPVVVVGRDGRMTGDACARIIIGTLQTMGCDVIYAGLATTPTIQMAVIEKEADGAIAVTASHNPAEWNAMKLLNENGEFLEPDQADKVYTLADTGESELAHYTKIGSYTEESFLEHHIAEICALESIDVAAIDAYDFRVVVDGINSVGGIAMPALLEALGVEEENVICINCEPTGDFAHPPEPKSENIGAITDAVLEHDADLAVVVDPDVDRLIFIDEDGSVVSEELTQVIAADYVWRFIDSPFVTNLSASRIIDDVADKHDAEVYRSAIGEINVVLKMKEVGARLGGEGTGSPILTDLHYGRDALLAAALALSYIAVDDTTLSKIVETYPRYEMSKQSVKVKEISMDVDDALRQIQEQYQGNDILTVDGVKILFDDSWAHLRESTTEPIIRVYTEAPTKEAADELAQRFVDELRSL